MNRTKPTILVEGYKLETPGFFTKLQQKPNSADDWQHHLSPKPTNTSAFDTDKTTQIFQKSTLETSPQDLYELFQDAPDNYSTKPPTHLKTNSNSDIHHKRPNKFHVTIKTSCDSKKPPYRKKITYNLTKNEICHMFQFQPP